MPQGFQGGRYWLLSHFGEMVDHDLLRDCLTSAHPRPGQYPGVFFHIEPGTLLPCVVHLRKAVSLPMPFPRLQVQAVEGCAGLVALRVLDGHPVYMRATPHNTVDLTAAEINAWERFLPLSEAMIHAFAILGQSHVGAISDADEGSLPAFTFLSHHRGQIGTHVFDLAPNMAALENVAQLAQGSRMTLALETASGPCELTVSRS